MDFRKIKKKYFGFHIGGPYWFTAYGVFFSKLGVFIGYGIEAWKSKNLHSISCFYHIEVT